MCGKGKIGSRFCEIRFKTTFNFEKSTIFGKYSLFPRAPRLGLQHFLMCFLFFSPFWGGFRGNTPTVQLFFQRFGPLKPNGLTSILVPRASPCLFLSLSLFFKSLLFFLSAYLCSQKPNRLNGYALTST